MEDTTVKVALRVKPIEEYGPGNAGVMTVVKREKVWRQSYRLHHFELSLFPALVWVNSFRARQRGVLTLVRTSILLGLPAKPAPDVIGFLVSFCMRCRVLGGVRKFICG